MALERAPGGLIASSVVASRIRFIVGLALVTIGAGAFAVVFRASLTAVSHTFYGADSIVDSIARLPRWLRLTVPVVAAAVAESIARLRSSRTQGVQQRDGSHCARTRAVVAAHDSIARCVFVGRNRRAGCRLAERDR